MQIAASIAELTVGGFLESEKLSKFNIDFNIFITISNLLLIFVGFFTLHSRIEIEKFFHIYFFSTSIIWHMAFLTWNITPNAVLFYYSEWSRGIFSGPVANANHAAVVTLLIFIYYLLQFWQYTFSLSKNLSLYSSYPMKSVVLCAQSAIFFYYTVQANSLMVNATLFFIVVLFLAFLISSKWSGLIYLASSVACLGIAIAYMIALIMLNPTRITLSGFEARQIIAREAIRLIIERPVLGYGTGSEYLTLLGRSMTAIPELIFQSAHSYYLDFLLQYGGAGFLLAFTGVFIVPMSVWILSGRQRGKVISSTDFLIWILWLVLLLTALTDFALSIPSVSMLLCIVTGGVYRQFANRHSDSSPLA